MISIIIPHYRNGKTTAYAIYKQLKHKFDHDIQIIVIDNSPNDKEGLKYIQPFFEHIIYKPYNSNKIQSHGVAYDVALSSGLVNTEYFITTESDSYPTSDEWLDYYEKFINADVDAAGSILTLSGGCFFHPCGMLYKTSVWHEANEYVKTIQYKYFPNMSMQNGFACHLMVHTSILDKFLENPEDYIVLADGYKPYSKEKALERLRYYSPIGEGVFHNGMGANQESVLTYGQRTFNIDVPHVLLNNRQRLVHRIGFEPGQWLTNYMYATNKVVSNIPIETKWLPNREGQQQEYTINQAGFKHLWAGSSFLDMKGTDMNDVYEFKKNQIDELYNSLPKNLKVNE